MKIDIQGKNIELSGITRENIAGRLQTVEKYLHGETEVSVLLQHEKHSTRVDIRVRAGRVSVRGSAETEHPARALEEAAAKIEAQLRRRKDRVKSHRVRTAGRQLVESQEEEPAAGEGSGGEDWS